MPAACGSWQLSIHLSQQEFSDLAAEALRSLPGEFAGRMENVSVEIQPLPEAKLLRSMKLSRDVRLLGVYSGVPMTRKSVLSPVDWPERIIIFQRNVEAVCGTRRDIIRQVQRTVLHEVGHHFGLTEDDLRRLGYG